MNTVAPMTFEQAKALAGLYMVSDPSPLSPGENALVEAALAGVTKAFGFDSWVDLYHAKEMFCESPHTLTEAHTAIATLKSMAAHIAESSRAASAHIQACQQSVGQTCEALVKGIDVAMFEAASRVIYISHSDKEIRMIDRARADVLGGFKTMRRSYFGSKHYAQFSYQDAVYEYWAYPSYGRIVSDIGMVKSARGRDISAEEVEACLYALDLPYDYAKWFAANAKVGA